MDELEKSIRAFAFANGYSSNVATRAYYALKRNDPDWTNGKLTDKLVEAYRKRDYADVEDISTLLTQVGE